MPGVNKKFKVGTFRLDARPDRIDLRDRAFQPRLVSLPAEYPDPGQIEGIFPEYTRRLILDQGDEGACTGFGLAAVINYLRFKRSLETDEKVERVSSRMLYHLARIYDEWPGEDYEGSSCRGAMKGWHRHGVCLDPTWPYRNKRQEIAFVKPETGWQDEAANCPLGAYYRINKDSVVDMQSAVCEVGAVYVSAEVHDGWDLGVERELSIMEIPRPLGDTGGHAFTIVGYNTVGFIVQNSWGPNWGFHGFAVMQYRDWVERGTDAWVAVLGAPMELQKSRRRRVDISTRRTRSSHSLKDAAAGRVEWFWSSDRKKKTYPYEDPNAQPLTEAKAYEHTVVLGNNGRPINAFLDVETEEHAIREVVEQIPHRALTGATGTPKLMIYAHGGLNNEDASVNRIRMMAPYFSGNDIHPLFITWRTGFMESLDGMLEDALLEFMRGRDAERAEGIFDAVEDLFNKARQKLAEARDRSIELAAERLIVKPIWTQMKQNAAAGARSRAGLWWIANRLRALVDRLGELEIHLVGHSAGSILLGHLLELFVKRDLPVTSCTLFAPACTVNFALQHYGPGSNAVKGNILGPHDLFFNILSETRERGDSVGPYGKSLLYLVSRALEDVHRMPIVGMEGAWRNVEPEDLWHDDTGHGFNESVQTWRNYARRLPRPSVLKDQMVSSGPCEIPAAHGSFDNDVKVMTETIRRIRGRALKLEVENLHGL